MVILLFWLVGALLIGLAIPLIRRTVRPNALYGLRVGETLESEAVWYEANARSARDLLALGVGTILVSSFLFAIKTPFERHIPAICCVGLVVGVLWYAGRGIAIAREVKSEFAEAEKTGRAQKES